MRRFVGFPSQEPRLTGWRSCEAHRRAEADGSRVHIFLGVGGDYVFFYVILIVHVHLCLCILCVFILTIYTYVYIWCTWNAVCYEVQSCLCEGQKTWDSGDTKGGLPSCSQKAGCNMVPGQIYRKLDVPWKVSFLQPLEVADLLKHYGATIYQRGWQGATIAHCRSCGCAAPLPIKSTNLFHRLNVNIRKTWWSLPQELG